MTRKIVAVCRRRGLLNRILKDRHQTNEGQEIVTSEGQEIVTSHFPIVLERETNGVRDCWPISRTDWKRARRCRVLQREIVVTSSPWSARRGLWITET